MIIFWFAQTNIFPHDKNVPFTDSNGDKNVNKTLSICKLLHLSFIYTLLVSIKITIKSKNQQDFHDKMDDSIKTIHNNSSPGMVIFSFNKFPPSPT